jgi:hypothetical protein
MADRVEQEEEETVTDEQPELPPEVDAFLKGKNKYRHPYGDWKPVVKVEPLKRLDQHCLFRRVAFLLHSFIQLFFLSFFLSFFVSQ